MAIPENIYVTILYSRDLELGGKKYELMVFTSQVGQWHSLFRFLRSNLSQILLFGRFYQLAGQLRGILVRGWLISLVLKACIVIPFRSRNKDFFTLSAKTSIKI